MVDTPMILSETLHQDPGPFLRPCPRCGAMIPTNIKACWNCGKVLDLRLIDLAKRFGVKP